jgi:tetratricopeptide (TPR) repeat protein
MLVRLAGLAVLSCLLFSLAACAARPFDGGPVLPAGQVLAITHSPGGPEVDAVVEAFYGPAFDPATFGPKLEGALSRYPDNPDLHEVAAFLARLRGDDDLSELHFLRAALDVGAAAPGLYLRGLNANHELVIQACRLIAAGHPNVEARGQARQLLLRTARLRDDDEDAQAQIKALGILSHWQVAGSFDNDEGKGFAQRYPPEEGLDFQVTMPGMLVPIRWRPVTKLGRFGDLDLDGMLWPNRQAVAYAVTFLRTAEDVETILWLNTNSPMRAFLDGEEVLSRETLAPNGHDSLRTPVRLTAGQHALLLKTANKGTSWFLSARLTTPDGRPLSGLVEASSPPPGFVAMSPAHAAGAGASTHEGPKPKVARMRVLPEGFGIRAGLGHARGLLLQSRLLVWEGDMAGAVREANAFLALSPGNLVGVYYVATTSRSNDEQGKALDLLNEGVKRAGATLPRFLSERAHVYMDRSMLEKAQVDAEAFVARRPRDLEAELLLSQVEGRRNFQVERCRTLATTVKDHDSSVQALRELAHCRIEDGHEQDARALLGKAQQIAPGSLDTLQALADLERRTFHASAAARYATAMRDRAPTWLGAWLESGELAWRAGQRGEARSYWQAASLLSPDSPQPLTRLADLAFDAGETSEAVRLWTLASTRDPANGLLSERLEHLSPIRLGFIQKYIPTDDEIDAAVAAGGKLTPEEGSHSVLLLDDEVTEVHADGSSTRVVTDVTRAVTEQGRDALIQAHVPTSGRLKILKAYALGKNGEQQETASARGGVLRFRNVTVGSTVVLQYIHYQPTGHFLPNEFVADWSFSGVAQEHVMSRWTVVLPAARALHVQTTGAVESERKDEGGYQVHRFFAKNVPPLIQEPYTPPLPDLLRRVSLSTVPTWDIYAHWERALLAEAFPASPELGTLARKLTADAKTPREKLDRLTAYVAQEIRYQQDYESTVAGVRPHSSRQIIERGYGDCKDKAVLLIALSREVGLDVDFALLRTLPAGVVQRDVPNQQFNHAIAYVPAQAGIEAPVFVDATTDALDVGSLRSDDQGAWSLVLAPNKPDAAAEFMQIPYRAAADEYQKSDVAIRVESDEVKATDRIEMRGSLASELRRVLRNPAYAKKAEEGLVATLFPASTMVSAKNGDPSDVWHPITLTLEIDASKALEKNGTSRRLRLPSNSSGLDRLVALTDRKLPLRLGIEQSVETKVSVELPPGSQVVELPQDFEESTTCMKIRRKSAARGSHVDSTVTVVRTCSDVSPGEYHAFRDHLLSAATHLQEQLAYRSSPANAAPKAAGR